MKTLPYLKQLTYASIILAFPFIFSASRDTAPPAPLLPTVEASPVAAIAIKTETVKTFKLTIDSLKNSSRNLLYPAK